MTDERPQSHKVEADLPCRMLNGDICLFTAVREDGELVKMDEIGHRTFSQPTHTPI